MCPFLSPNFHSLTVRLQLLYYTAAADALAEAQAKIESLPVAA